MQGLSPTRGNKQDTQGSREKGGESWKGKLGAGQEWAVGLEQRISPGGTKAVLSSHASPSHLLITSFNPTF